MAKGHKPVSGSRSYWPKKRARAPYLRIKTRLSGEGIQDFACYKAGMTQISVIDSRKGSTTQGKEIFFPATVMTAPNLVVCGIKAYKRGPYGLRCTGSVWAGNLSKDLPRKTGLPKKPKTKELEGDEFRLLVHTKPREAVGKKKPELFELLVPSKEKATELLGKELSVGDVFKEGEYVDTHSVSKGKGYQGVVKRFGVKIRTRKAKLKRRHIGVLAPRGVARVLPNSVAMAGQMGYQTRTEYNKLILKVGQDGLTPKGGWLNFGEVKGSYIVVKGSIPGPKKRLIMLRKGVRSPGNLKFEVKHISLDQQQ